MKDWKVTIYAGTRIVHANVSARNGAVAFEIVVRSALLEGLRDEIDHGEAVVA